jgi:hypothetical protein
MPCGSPCGLFVGLSQVELDALRVSALAAITSGRRTSLSGGQKSGSKEWKMDPQQMLIEIRYAERQAGTIPARVSKTYFDSANPPCPANVPNEQV